MKTPSSCFFLFSLLVLFFLPTVRAANMIELDHLVQGTVYFSVQGSQGGKNGQSSPGALQSFKTGLFDLNHLGVLQGKEDGSDYFLFSGKSCEDCLEDRALYLFRSTGGKGTPFVYPGKIFEPKTRHLVLESRAFFGKCLPGMGDVLAIFQKEKVDRKARFQSSVIVAEPSKSYLKESLLESRLPPFHFTLGAVKRKVCQEIEGRKRIMLSRPIDIQFKHLKRPKEVGNVGSVTNSKADPDSEQDPPLKLEDLEY